MGLKTGVPVFEGHTTKHDSNGPATPEDRAVADKIAKKVKDKPVRKVTTDWLMTETSHAQKIHIRGSKKRP